MRPFWIAGYPRAGTTLTQAILDSSPKISITNEQSYVHMMHDVHRRLIPRADAEPMSIPIQDYEQILSLIEKNWAQVLYDFHKLRKPEAEICGDKLPAQIKYLDWLRQIFPGSKFILCTRNHEDCLASMRRAITVYKNADEKYARNALEAYERLYRLNKDKEDVYTIDLDEVQAGKHNEIFTGAAKFLGVDTEFDLEIVQPQEKPIEHPNIAFSGEGFTRSKVKND